jgi:hypothetical protein
MTTELGSVTNLSAAGVAQERGQTTIGYQSFELMSEGQRGGVLGSVSTAPDRRTVSAQEGTTRVLEGERANPAFRALDVAIFNRQLLTRKIFGCKGEKISIRVRDTKPPILLWGRL